MAQTLYIVSLVLNYSNKLVSPLHQLWFYESHKEKFILFSGTSMISYRNKAPATLTTSAAAVGSKVETCYHHMQMSSIAVHCIHLMQANFLPIKFWIWKFCSCQVDREDHGNHIPWKFDIYDTAVYVYLYCNCI